MLFVAGYTATNKLYGMLEMAAVSYGYAISTYTGQNLGAGLLDRIRSGVRSALGLAMGTSATVSLIMILLGRIILRMFVSGADADTVLNTAYTYLLIMAVFLPILYLLHLYRSALQGLGDTVMPMVSGFAELVMRVGCAIVLPLWIAELGVFYAEIAAWAGAAAVLMVSYFLRMRHLRRNPPAVHSDAA